ncbi:MAG TPA: hypothetical protein DEG69_10405, partial [Flavobacteriaceae bacterium]|nr:hypothetical protein [Flavobacteriaceae bacterium]
PTTGYGTSVDFDKKGTKGVKIYDAKKQVGLLGLYGKTSTSGYVEAPISKITEYTDWMDKLPKKAKPNLPGSKIGFRNVEFRSLTKELEDNKQKGLFSKLVRSNLATVMEQLAQDFSTSILGNDAIKPASIKQSGGALFSTSAEGNIFETAVNALTASSPGRNRAQAFEAALAADQQQVWDFEERGNASSRFKSAFDFNDGLIKADAKRTLSRGAGESMVNKIFNTKGGLSGASWADDLVKARDSVRTAANGFIPNFNALFESVRREKEAGVPAGRIRVAQSSRLKSGSNPAGLGVYNTRDEPMGLNQGINNSVAAGMDPKRQGSFFGGFVPNYAGPSQSTRNKRVPEELEFPIVLHDKTKNALRKSTIRAFTDAEAARQQMINDTPGSGGIKNANAHVVNEGARIGTSATPSDSGSDKVVKATEENTASMKSINRQNRDNSMRTVGALMLVQQASTGLQNVIGDTNNKLSDVVSEIGSLITIIIGLRYASDQLTQGMRERAERMRNSKPDRTLLSGDSKLDRKVGMGTASNDELNLHDAMLSSNERVQNSRSGKAARFGDRIAKTPPKIGRFAGARGMGRRALGGAIRGGSVGAAKLVGGAGKFVAGGGLLAVGGAVAGLKLIGELGTKWSASNQELEAATKALAIQKETTEKNIGHLNKFGTAAQQAAAVFENQNASMTELSIATKAVDKAMLELPAEMRAKLGGIIDPKRVNSMIESMVSKEQDRLAQVQKRADSATLMEEAREKTGFFDVLKGDMTFLGFGKGNEQQLQDDRQVGDLGKSIISSMVSKDPKALEGVDV